MVPAGPFWWGCTYEGVEPDPGCTEAAHPLARVEVPAFEIDTTEVPRRDYALCVERAEPPCEVLQCGSGGDDLWEPPEHGDDHPTECATRPQAARYCAWVGKRLCAEAEWAKAARGDDARPYPWGSALPGPEHANCRPDAADQSAGDLVCRDDFLDGTAPVGSFLAGESPWGALDLVGNVSEWVAEDFAPEILTEATVRGGSFDGPASDQLLYLRSPQAADTRGTGLGFRCCRDIR